MKKVVIFNPKGGAGKTTCATNLASYYASRQFKTALMDFDVQGSSSCWLKRRPGSARPIQSIPAYQYSNGATRSWLMRADTGTERLVIDTPAGADVLYFKDTINCADAVVIPVMPSCLDIDAVAHSIADLLLQAKVDRRSERIAVIANRSRKNTMVYHRLEKFLGSLCICFVSTLRDTQNYVKAAEQGMGIFELKGMDVKKDVLTWQPIIEWIESRPAYQLSRSRA